MTPTPIPTPPAYLKEALDLLATLEPTPTHVYHVAELALQLFDQLSDLHRLGARPRAFLQVAGYLHDVGHHCQHPGESHHHASARRIREHPWQTLDPREVELIAQIARYHRKALPRFEHEKFVALTESDRAIVQILAGLLRLADACDRTHRQLIKQIQIELRPDQILFHLEASSPVSAEINAAYEKGDLAQMIFQRDLVFVINGLLTTPPPPVA